jgi:hypothetical protein
MKAQKYLLIAATLTALILTVSCAGRKSVDSAGGGRGGSSGIYIDRAGGFSVVSPDSWKIVDNPQLTYKMFMSSNKADSSANANFNIHPSFANLDDYVKQSVNDLKSTFRVEIIGTDDFKTAKGLQGKKIVAIMDMEEALLRMSFYIFPDGKGSYMIATYSARASFGEKFDAVADKSMKTFKWIEREKTSDYAPGGPYADKNGGFSVVPPESWKMFQKAKMPYKAFVSANEADSNANLNFNIEPYKLPLDDFAEHSVNRMKSIFDAEIIGTDDFETARGLNGKKIIALLEQNGRQFRVSFYLFSNGKGQYMTVTCTSISSIGEKFDAVFDKSMKTFEWIEQ